MHKEVKTEMGNGEEGMGGGREGGRGEGEKEGERERRRERRQQLVYTCAAFAVSAFNDVAPPTLEMVVSLLISSRGRREGW